MPVENGLTVFRALVSDYRSITTWTVGGSIVAPLSDLVFKIGPPYPSGVSIITSIVELLVLMGIFQFWNSLSARAINKRLVIALNVAAISFILYLILLGTATFIEPVGQQRLVKGFWLRPEAAAQIETIRKKPGKAGYTIDEFLRGKENDPELVWTMFSITFMRIALILTWLAMFVGLAGFIGMFVMFQRSAHLPDA
jgi:hypothetical protein